MTRGILSRIRDERRHALTRPRTRRLQMPWQRRAPRPTDAIEMPRLDRTIPVHIATPRPPQVHPHQPFSNASNMGHGMRKDNHHHPATVEEVKHPNGE